MNVNVVQSTVPVKRHRGEPGHTYGTHGRIQAHPTPNGQDTLLFAISMSPMRSAREKTHKHTNVETIKNTASIGTASRGPESWNLVQHIKISIPCRSSVIHSFVLADLDVIDKRYRAWGRDRTRRAQGCDTTRRVDILLFNILLHGIWPNDTAGSKDYTVCYYPTLLVTLLSIAPIEY